MLDVEVWAEIRRLHFVGGLSARELARRTGRGLKTSAPLRAPGVAISSAWRALLQS